ncbi:MAG: ankyrin repeat domain-containing protein [Acidobacteria bacterium]|nr:ankyrin repeat domain-containing protein [Acidobacteriota bacterium]
MIPRTTRKIPKTLTVKNKVVIVVGMAAATATRKTTTPKPTTTPKKTITAKATTNPPSPLPPTSRLEFHPRGNKLLAMVALEEAIKARDLQQALNLVASDPSLCSNQTSMGVSVLMMALYFELPQLARAIQANLTHLTFFESAAMGDLSAVQQAVAADLNQRNAFSPDGFTVLGLAIFFRQPQVAQWLIEAGADVNLPAANARKVAPIPAACARNDLDTLRLLIAAGANPDLAQEGGFTVRQAIATNNQKMEAMLRAAGATLA